jgi:hypothetical protein
VPLKNGFISPEELANWDVHLFNSIPVGDYLDNLDFFVYFHNPGMKEAYGMAILEAMSNDVVCILPEGFRIVFGSAAVYCEVSDVQDRLRELWANPRLYRSQQERGRQFVAEQGSPAALMAHLARFGVRATSGSANSAKE